MLIRARRKAFVFAAAAAWLVAVALAVDHFQKQARLDAEIVTWPELRDGWDPTKLDDIGKLRWDLWEMVLDEVSFEELPFSECLAQLERTIADQFPHIEPIAFRIEEAVSPTVPVTLRLRQIPALVILRVLGGIASAKTDLELGRTAVFHIDDPNDERFREEGWFRIHPGFFHAINAKAETVDVREHLERLGIGFESGETALYYPKRDLLWASASYGRMEKIDVFVSSMIVCYTPTWKDRMYEWRYHLTSGFRSPVPLPPAPPASPPSVGGAPDPFGGRPLP